MTVTGSREALKQALVEFSDFINEPPQYEDKRMVRDYRHELARMWIPLVGKLLPLLSPDPAGVTLTVEQIARLCCDGMSNGNIQWDEANETLRSDCLSTATAILSLIQKSVQPSIVTKPATSGTAAPVCELGGAK